MSAALVYLFFGFVGGFACREVGRLWLSVIARFRAPRPTVTHWGQLHVDADRRQPFGRAW